MGEHRRATIAIMFGNTQSEYSEELMAGFRTCAQEEDVNLIFLMGPQIPDYCTNILSENFSWGYEYQFHTVYDYAHLVKPDAIIIAYGSLAGFPQVPDRDEFLARYKDIPCLMLEDISGDEDVPYLVAGNYSGMRKCMEHLVDDHGYRKIGFVGGPDRNFDSNERLRAYRDVLTEHGIPITDTMVVYGDYTEAVDAEVEYLLDHNPGLEAIAFANDNMAKAGYRVCAARDLLVGHDIAITGFDDADIAKSMEPPLTSVSHSSFLFSHQALQRALMLCRGQKPESREMEAFFHRRSSCGCWSVGYRLPTGEHTPEELKQYVADRLKEIAEELFSSIPYEQDKQHYIELLEEFFGEIASLTFAWEQDVSVGKTFSLEKELSIEPLMRALKRLCDYPYVSKRPLFEHISQLIKELIDFEPQEKTRSLLASVIDLTQQYIHSDEMMALETELIEANRKEWFIPSFTMDLVSKNLGVSENLRLIMQRLHAMQVKSTYIFFFEEAIEPQEHGMMQMPDVIMLAAYYNDREMVCYPPEDWRPVAAGEGFASVLPQGEAHFYTAFVLFCGEEQYGLLLCEVEQKDIQFMLICSIQLGFLRKVMLLNQLEQQMKKELQEKNRILNFISVYDELTNVHNRRGFMERAMRVIAEHSGQQAYLIFSDIDHLKEINDCFGHAAGDFAIQTAAGYLRDCLPHDAVIARIGGDEFVAVICTEQKDYRVLLSQKLKRHAQTFNEGCEQPFYVEMSTGIHEFVCDAGMDLAGLLRQSDSVLYEEKARRRASIKK